MVSVTMFRFLPTIFFLASMDQTDHGLHLLVRITHDLTVRAAQIAHGQGHGQFAAAGLADPSVPHPLLDQMQFRLADRALQSQQHPVVVLGRVIDAVGVCQQSTRQRAQLQQLMPFAAAAGQTRHFHAQHQAHMVQADLGDQTLEASPLHDAGCGVSQVLVDHQDPGRSPAQVDGPLRESVLQPGGLGMIEDLLRSRLTDIDHREPVAMHHPGRRRHPRLLHQRPRPAGDRWQHPPDLDPGRCQAPRFLDHGDQLRRHLDHHCH